MGQASSSSSSTPTVAIPEHSVLDVELQIVSAKGIAAGDHFGLAAALKGHMSSSDAYALIEVDGKKVAWTRPVFDTLEPVWNETFFFKNVRPDTLCKLYVLDKDMDADDALGQTQFTAANTDGREVAFELPISRGDKQAGTISIRVKSHPISSSEGLEQYGPVHYSVHSSVAAGFITQSVSDDTKLESLAYHVQLHNVSRFLPTENEWNKNYPAIQRIFSPDHPEAPVLRKALAAEHALIYNHDPATVYSAVSSPDDFFKLVHKGQRLDKPVLFTYAIVKTGWYFSETGAAFFKDMLSKHMLHSGAQFSVLYAGEFHIEKSHFGHHKLVIDNNSGTYGPPKAELPQLKALFENNFPGISVEALDREDPDLIKARKEILDAWA